jgi:hypothetical protein
LVLFTRSYVCLLVLLRELEYPIKALIWDILMSYVSMFYLLENKIIKNSATAPPICTGRRDLQVFPSIKSRYESVEELNNMDSGRIQKPVLVPLCPLQHLHGVGRSPIRASAITRCYKSPQTWHHNNINRLFVGYLKFYFLRRTKRTVVHVFSVIDRFHDEFRRLECYPAFTDS